MINPDHLFAQAAKLAKPPARGRHRQADLRRSVSTAYYAVFHAALTDAADLMIGSSPSRRSSKAWALVYRGFAHNDMARRCRSLSNPPAPLGSTDFSQVSQAFAEAFLTLQNARHRADYDPHAEFSASAIRGWIESARAAVRVFHSGSKDERRLFAVYLLLGARPA